LVLRRDVLAYDSGIRPPQFDSWQNRNSPSNTWRSLFPKRRRVQLERRQLQSLRLRETDAGNRLTVDIDSDRIEIAQGATEIEREWLARLLASRYSLPQVLGQSEATTAPARR
jgi:hypothetical protein